jgi:DNA/RNA endonuclease G (NUC1)
LYKSARFRRSSFSRPRLILLTAFALFGIIATVPEAFITRTVHAVPPSPASREAPLNAHAVVLSDTVVISQVYGGGGNTGAPLLNDYVELYNRSDTAVSLNGWSVQYASATGTGNFGANPVTALSGSIAAGGYYLVKQASGGAVGVALPTPDVTGTVNMSGTAGKVALVNVTTGVACNGGSTPCPAGELAKIVDLVGYGNANFFEGAGAAPTLSNTTAGFRGNNGCTETDNNSADFATGAPNPRNSGSATSSCSGSNNPSGVGAANPNPVTPGNSTLLTVTVTPGTTPTSTGITVAGNLSNIGGSATQQFFDNATNGDVTAGDNIFSYQATVVVGTTGGVKSLPVSIGDAELRSGSTSISLTVQAPANPTVAGSANPSAVVQGASVTLTATVTPGLVPNSTGLAVTGDLSAIGGSATQQFFDDGSNGDAVAGNNIFTFQTAVPAATATGTKSLPISVTDAQARSGSGSISLTVTTTPAPHDPSEHMVMGNPSGAVADATNSPDNFLMMKLQYALSYNNTRRIPNWTSWHLDSTWRGSAPRQDDYRNDTTLPPGFYQVLGTDYQGSGFDRGHMDPSADRTDSIPDNSATFLMDNMVPQAPGNNQGPWADLENYLRAFLPGSELYIISGTTGVGGTGSNGGTTNMLASGVTVPQKTWKVALILPVGDNDVSRVDANARTIAVIMPNIDSIRPDQWQKYLATVDQVETLSGYDFFSNVSPAIQSVVESKLDAGNDTAPVTTGKGPLATPENQNLPIVLSATDFNVNNVFTYTIVAAPQHGSVSGVGANFTYSPGSNYIGPDSFTFKANDGALDSNVSTVTISVNAPTVANGTIAGRILDEDGTPVGGTLVRLSGTQNRRLITDADGNYQFDNVEASGFYTVTPTRANYRFSPGERSFSLSGNRTEASFTGDATGDSVNPLDTAEYFVRQQYLDLLGREPDETGLNYWSDQIGQCLSEPSGDASRCVSAQRIAVAAAFFIEQEFQRSGSFLYNVYAGGLGRRPALTEFASDRLQVVGGVNLETEQAAFVDAFVQRGDFTRKYATKTTAEDFVDALLVTVQQTSGVDLRSQRADLINRYRAGGTANQSRALVLRGVVENAAFKQAEYNSAFVLSEYFSYLGREPEQQGYDFWLNLLDHGASGDYRGMVCSFITSTEYQRRFSAVVTHTNRECGP